MPQSSPLVSLVIPAYNEAKRIERSLAEVQAFVRAQSYPAEVILVIERSVDGTLELARKIADGDDTLRIVANPVQRGKGFAVQTGMLRASGQFVFFSDLDLSTPLAEIGSFLGYFERHPEADVLIGNRQHPQSRIEKRQHPVREKMGQTFNLLIQAMILSGIKDTQCGFKAFRSRAVAPIFSELRTQGFAFDIEVLLRAREAGFRIHSLPVRWINSEDSKVRIVRDSLRMIQSVLKLKRLLTGSYFSAPVRIPNVMAELPHLESDSR